jgi:hypothetical protein
MSPNARAPTTGGTLGRCPRVRVNPGRPKLVDEVRTALRVRHRSPRTEEAHVHWIKRFIRFHGLRHPKQLGSAEISQFLKHLAIEQHVSASTQTQALSALVFLYRHVLQSPFEWIDNLERAKRPSRLPVVKTTEIYTHVLNRGPRGIMSPLDETMSETPMIVSAIRQSSLQPNQDTARSLSQKPSGRAAQKTPVDAGQRRPSR